MGNTKKSRCSIKTKFPTGPKPSTYVSTEISITSLWTGRKNENFWKWKTGFIRGFLDVYFNKEIQIVNHLQNSFRKIRLENELNGWKGIAVLFSRPERRKRKYCPRRDFAKKAKCQGGTLVTRAYIKESTYSWNIQSYSQYRKISICLNRDREESVDNDDVSIVCARKYEMVRMT